MHSYIMDIILNYIDGNKTNVINLQWHLHGLGDIRFSLHIQGSHGIQARCLQEETQGARGSCVHDAAEILPPVYGKGIQDRQ